MIIKCQCVNCGKGIEFEAEQLGDSKFRVINCPHCGKETVLTMPKPPETQPPAPPAQTVQVEEKSPIKSVAKVLTTLLVIAFIVLIISLINNPSSTPSPSSTPADSSWTVEISHVEAQRNDYGGMQITGIIQNRSSAMLDLLTVHFSIFDDDNNKVDDVYDYISSLDGLGTWKFKAVSLRENAAKYRLEEISCRYGQLQVKMNQ